MGHLIALSGDIFAFVLIWRAQKLVRQKHQKMYETASDVKMRKYFGIFLVLLGLLAIYADHFLFNF